MDDFVKNFSNNSLIKFFQRNTNKFEISLNPIEDYYDTKKFSDLINLGKFTLDDSSNLFLFSCKSLIELNKRSARKEQYEIARKILKDYSLDAGIFVFYDKTSKFRFTFIRQVYGSNTNERFSDWKRYSYFINPDKTNRTFKENLNRFNLESLDSIQSAFSVEELTKEFYSKLYDWFNWAKDSGKITFPNLVCDQNDSETLEKHLIRLITRFLFTWFLKQKELIPDYFFNIEELKGIIKDFKPYSDNDGKFYNSIVQNLFFASLNSECSKRSFANHKNDWNIKTKYRYRSFFSDELNENKILELFKNIPFLNGGLFECLDKVTGTHKNEFNVDGFSNNLNKNSVGIFEHIAFIPNNIFFDEKLGLIPLLNQFNFTIEESDPNEIEVALDPELLGNVFENLLSTINPETGRSERNATGSFYTPKSLVQYMVNESLIEYLSRVIKDIDYDEIEKLIIDDSLPSSFKEESNKKKIASALNKCKILDPACGSGAFPMGIFQKIIHVLLKLEIINYKNLYDSKLNLIENNIFGVDIQNIAIQICKLRFFISLIIEQEVDNFKENRGLVPLPNLETKFVAANSLIPLGKNRQIGLYEDSELDNLTNDLFQIREKHFFARSVEYKIHLRLEDLRLRTQINTKLKNNIFDNNEAELLASWNPYDQNSTSSFLSCEYMFGIKDGFDIIIGNPPYVSLQVLDKKYLEKLKNLSYECFSGNGDIYYLFIEASHKLLKSSGILIFITSNTWLRTDAAKNLRNFLLTKTNVLKIIDFGEKQLFQAATVSTSIILLSKEQRINKTKAITFQSDKFSEIPSKFQKSEPITFEKNEIWNILSPIEKSIKAKVESYGTPLEKWDIRINYGVKTGFNEAFIINGKTRESILNDCKSESEREKTAQLIRPILRGQDIGRESYTYANQWLICLIPYLSLNIENFPALDKFLVGFKKKLEQRGLSINQNDALKILRYAESYDIKISLHQLKKSRKLTNYKWYEVQDGINYWDEFFKPKIVYQEIASDSGFILDSKGDFIVANSAYVMTGEDIKYLYKVLNSKLIKYIFDKFYATRLGKSRRRLKKDMARLPIPKDREFINNVLGIEDPKRINLMLLDFYNLNDEEIRYLDL